MLQRQGQAAQPAVGAKVGVDEGGARRPAQGPHDAVELGRVAKEAVLAVHGQGRPPKGLGAVLADPALWEGHVGDGAQRQQEVVGQAEDVLEGRPAALALHGQVRPVLVGRHPAAHAAHGQARERGRRRALRVGHQALQARSQLLAVGQAQPGLPALIDVALHVGLVEGGGSGRQRLGRAQQVDGQRQLDGAVEDGRRGHQHDPQVGRRRHDGGQHGGVKGPALADDVLHLVHHQHRVPKVHGLGGHQANELVVGHDLVPGLRRQGPRFGVGLAVRRGAHAPRAQLLVKVAHQRGREHDHQPPTALPGLAHADGRAGLARADLVEQQQAQGLALGVRTHELGGLALRGLQRKALREAQLPKRH